MHVSFRVNSEYESLMRDLAKREIRTKWLNEAVAFYASKEFKKGICSSDNSEIIKRLDEIKSLLLCHLEQTPTNQPAENKNETKKDEYEEHDTFFNILATGIDQSL